MLELDLLLLRDVLESFLVYPRRKGLCLYRRVRNFARRTSRVASRGFCRIEPLSSIFCERIKNFGNTIIIIIIKLYRERSTLRGLG